MVPSTQVTLVKLNKDSQQVVQRNAANEYSSLMGVML